MTHGIAGGIERWRGAFEFVLELGTDGPSRRGVRVIGPHIDCPQRTYCCAFVDDLWRVREHAVVAGNRAIRDFVQMSVFVDDRFACFQYVRESSDTAFPKEFAGQPSDDLA